MATGHLSEPHLCQQCNNPIIKANKPKAYVLARKFCCRQCLYASKKGKSNGRETHQMTGTREHATWLAMLGRCRNKNHQAYRNYGARGITVCERWQGPEGFANFYFDMGPRPSKKHSLDRINNELGYCPENCRWTTMEYQQRNTRRNRMITHEGVTMCVTEWSRKLGIRRATIHTRINKGLPTHEILAK